MKKKTNDKNTNFQEKLNQTLEKLEEGVKIFQDSEQFKDYLRCMSKFHNYSVNNSLLIYMQMPEATHCASFTTWKSLNRFVKKDEKAITILAPAFKKIEVEKQNPDGTPMIGKDGKPEKEVHTIPRYRATSTFDVSQTDGEPLPEIVSELKGDVTDYQILFDTAKEVCGIPVEFEDIQSGAKGYYNFVENRIAIKSGMSEEQTLKTLFHEIAHSKLDNLDLRDDEELKTNRLGKETRAEATAFVVADHFGIDTSEYSFGYITSWSSGKELKELREQMETIRKTASEMITDMEKILYKDLEQNKTEDNVIDLPTPAEPLSHAVGETASVGKQTKAKKQTKTKASGKSR